MCLFKISDDKTFLVILLKSLILFNSNLTLIIQVLDTLPIRTMVCKCITGYQGNAAIACTPVPTCPAGRGLVLNAYDECVCPEGYYLDDEGRFRYQNKQDIEL